jgi:hypothetical protein
MPDCPSAFDATQYSWAREACAEIPRHITISAGSRNGGLIRTFLVGRQKVRAPFSSKMADRGPVRTYVQCVTFNPAQITNTYFVFCYAFFVRPA